MAGLEPRPHFDMKCYTIVATIARFSSECRKIKYYSNYSDQSQQGKQRDEPIRIPSTICLQLPQSAYDPQITLIRWD